MRFTGFVERWQHFWRIVQDARDIAKQSVFPTKKTNKSLLSYILVFYIYVFKFTVYCIGQAAIYF